MDAERIRAAVTAPLEAAGFVVEEVRVTPAGRRSVVRVAVDRDIRALLYGDMRAPRDGDMRAPRDGDMRAPRDSDMRAPRDGDLRAPRDEEAREARGQGARAQDPIPPLSLDEVADATRVVDRVLESAPGLAPGPYVLEVSSPGVDRPLTELHHFRRNVGRLVRLRLTDGQTAGRIVAVDAGAVHLREDPAAGDALTGPSSVAFALIESGRVVLEFGSPGESGPTTDDQRGESHGDRPDALAPTTAGGEG